MLTKEEAFHFIRQTVIETMGCTDPVAIALAVSTAYHALEGDIESVEVFVDRNLYKNAMGVGIPGTNEKGIELAIACALMLKSSPSKKLLLLEEMSQECLQKAKNWLEKGLVHVQVDSSKNALYVEAKVRTTHGVAKAIIQNYHDQIVYLEVNGKTVIENAGIPTKEKKEMDLSLVSLPDFISVLDQISDEDFSFLHSAVEKNLQAAEMGLSQVAGMSLGKSLQKLLQEGIVEDSFFYRLKYTIAAASDARMGGKKIPITGCGGSGNHGITFFITVGMAFQNVTLKKFHSLEKSLALGLLVLVAIKSQTGTLTPMCGCAVAAASAAAASICYMLGGTESQIASSIELVLANLIGMICDGAKFGCALKTSTSGPVAVESALLALQDVSIRDEGVIGKSFLDTLSNLSPLHKVGMKQVDATIVDILLSRQVANKK